MRVPWSLTHCISIKEARSRAHKADLVILKPEMEGLRSPERVFKSINNMVFEIPILVLTSEEGQNAFSSFVMEQGAADTLIRGQFARLVDAIEFALIRQKLKTDVRQKSDQKKIDNKHTEDAHNEKQRQILRMFGGDYSMDQSQKK